MKYFILLCGFLSVISCTRSNNPSPAAPVTSSVQIDGIQMTDYNANPLDTIGKPNIRLAHNQYILIDYPNPAYGGSHCVVISTKDSAQVQLVLVAGVYSGTLPTAANIAPNFILQTPVVANLALVGQATPVFSYSGTAGIGANNGLNVPVLKDTTIPNGFYKMTVYITSTTGKDTLWDNIWVNH